MKNVIKDAEGKLSTIMEKLSEVVLKEGQGTKYETTLIDISELFTDNEINQPDTNCDFFKATETEEQWWENNKVFVGFALLIVLSAFVFCNCFRFLDRNGCPTGYLLFFFGVIAILFIGLVVVALFMIKASVKCRAEKNERKNKLLAFKLKMMETEFDLGNRKIITEKKSVEKELLMKEKDYLYSLDEKQREADHKRKLQLKQFEILEGYMKHMAELAKSGQNNTGNIDLLQIFGIITKEEQLTPNNGGTNGTPTAGEGKHDNGKENGTQGQQTASAEAKVEPAKEELNPAPDVEQQEVEPSPTKDKPEGQSDNQDVERI